MFGSVAPDMSVTTIATPLRAAGVAVRGRAGRAGRGVAGACCGGVLAPAGGAGACAKAVTLVASRLINKNVRMLAV